MLNLGTENPFFPSSKYTGRGHKKQRKEKTRIFFLSVPKLKIVSCLKNIFFFFSFENKNSTHYCTQYVQYSICVYTQQNECRRKAIFVSLFSISSGFFLLSTCFFLTLYVRVHLMSGKIGSFLLSKLLGRL